MQYRYAKKLHNGDQIQYKLDNGTYVSKPSYQYGKILSAALEQEKAIWFNILLDDGEYVSGVKHTELK